MNAENAELGLPPEAGNSVVGTVRFILVMVVVVGGY
jgi:hypothetical protein